MRRILWLVTVALGVATMLLVMAMAALADAKNNDAAGAQCSEATLDGRYLFAVAGYEVYDGNGHVKGVASTSVSGKITRKEPFSGTYAVKADCTGTVTYKDGTRYDLFIAPDGSTYTFLQSNPGVVVSGVEQRGTATRVG